MPPRRNRPVAGAYIVVNYGVRPVRSPLGGALGAAVGIRPTLLAVTVCAVAGFLWLRPPPIPRMATLPATAETG